MKTPTKPTKARISRVWIERKRDDAGLIGIIAKASIASAKSIRQVLNSGGIWVAPDFQHFPDAEADQLSFLRSELASFGFGPRAIGYAMKNVERKDIQ